MPSNNSFKPNLLRYTNNVAGKACHVVGSATQVGLTQALGNQGNIMGRSLTAIAIISLAGCASMGSSIPTPEQAMSAINSRFLGHPIGEAVMVYGVPDGQTEIQGHKVFIWHRTNTITYSKSETITTRGSVGDPSQYPWLSSVPYVASSTYNRPEAVGYQCVLSIGTDANGNIDGAAINGKMGACQVFVP